MVLIGLVVEHFGHRHIWYFQEDVVEEVFVIQDTKSRGIELVVELPKMDTLGIQSIRCGICCCVL